MFIKLTSSATEDSHFVRIKIILVICPISSGAEEVKEKYPLAKSQIIFHEETGIKTCCYRETPEEIMQLIKEAKNGNDL